MPALSAKEPAKGLFGKKDVFKIILLFAVLIGGVLAVHLTSLSQWFGRIEEVKDSIGALGILAPLVFFLGAAALIAVGVPRLPFCFAGGMIFGLGLGLLCSEAGTLLGSYAAFLFARWAGGDFVLRHRSKLGRFASLIDTKSVRGVVLCRQLPLASAVVNVALAVCPVTRIRFLVGTLIGDLPEAIVAVLIGSGLVQESARQALTYVSIATALLVLFWVAAVFLVARGKKAHASVQED